MTKLATGNELVNSQSPQGKDELKDISWRRRERALQILELFDRGCKVREIAQLYGISQRMVQKDLRLAEKLSGLMMKELNQGELLSRKILFYENLCRHAMRQCETSQNENAKIGWARLGKEAQDTLMKIYENTGIITTVPTRISVEEANPFSADPELRKEYLALLKKARERGLNLGGL